MTVANNLRNMIEAHMGQFSNSAIGRISAVEFPNDPVFLIFAPGGLVYGQLRSNPIWKRASAF
jgi:hypothetical protein